MKEKNKQTQCDVLGYRVGLYFNDYKLAIEIDENRHGNRNIGYKINRQNTIKQELNCNFIRIGPDKEDFDIFTTINEILFRQIN